MTVRASHCAEASFDDQCFAPVPLIRPHTLYFYGVRTKPPTFQFSAERVFLRVVRIHKQHTNSGSSRTTAPKHKTTLEKLSCYAFCRTWAGIVYFGDISKLNQHALERAAPRLSANFPQCLEPLSTLHLRAHSLTSLHEQIITTTRQR